MSRAGGTYSSEAVWVTARSGRRKLIGIIVAKPSFATLRSSKTDEKHQGRVRDALNAARSFRIQEAERCSKAFAATAARVADLRDNREAIEICVGLDGNVIQAARLIAS